MHYGLHGALNVALSIEGKQSPVAGTALIDDIADLSVASIDAIPNLPPTCKALAREKVEQQMFPLGNQPGRTTITLPDSTARPVLKRGFY